MVAAWATLETSEEAPHTLCFPITREDAQLQRRFGSESPGFVRAPKLLSIRARLVVHRRGQWQSFEAVDFATLIWVDWFNHRRLLEPIGNIPPAEAEVATTRCWTSRPSRPDSNQTASGDLGPFKGTQRHQSLGAKLPDFDR
jgi:hypothetical protein